MYKIILSEFIENDLNYISDIIFRFTFSQKSVNKTYNYIIEGIFSLQTFPYRHVEYEFNTDYRILNIKGKYKVFYKINEEKQEVQVYRILFSSSNYDNIF